MTPDVTAAHDVNWSARPTLRFSPPQGWMNDPVGLVTTPDEDGPTHHLFYQHDWPRTWGHATTRDFRSWQHHPVALRPDATGDCWSGSAVAFDGKIAALYTAWRSDETQHQALTTSNDGGRTWRAHAGNPVLRQPAGERHFRDPKVLWHAGTSSWVMLLACGRRLRLYRSPDLVDWTEVGTFDQDPPGPQGSVWECPDLFEMPIETGGGTLWVLLASYCDQAIFGKGEQFEGESGTIAFVGDFDGERFAVEAGPLPFSVGPDDYAAVTWPTSPPVAVGWMSHWSYGARVPDVGWQGMLTLPRKLYLSRESGRFRLDQRPAFALPEAAAIDRDLPRPSIATLDDGHFELLSDDRPYATIELGNGRLRLRRHATPGLPDWFDRTVEMEASGPATLVLDGGGIELFADGRHAAAACPVPPLTRVRVA
jgi:fructan beta-fructosidase